MNTIRTTVFLIVLSLSAGCASVAPEDSDCEGAKLRNITIVYQRHSKITVAPPRKEVDRGDAINYQVKGAQSRTFKAKGTKPPPEHPSASVTWLNSTGKGGTVGNGNSHIVCVPADQEPGDYEYLIEIEDVGALDPVVHVD